MSFRPPTMSEDFSVDLVVKYNRDLTDQINNLIEPGDEQIKQILANICHNMVRFAGYQGLNNPLETMKLGVWSSFFTPIKTLMNVPHPQRNFVTARMVLYLGSLIHQTFDDQVYPHKNKAKGEDNALSNFCINLDDALLKPLKNIWKDSKNSEDFKWAFAGDDIVLEPCHTVISAHELEVALALSPSERSRLSEKHGERFYYQEDAMAEPKLFKDPMPRWDCGQYNADLLWTSDGSDGPIRLEFWYDKSEDHDTVWDKHIPLFRRSKQFCLDARQICEDELGKQVRIQLNEIMKQHKVPREVHYQILRYLPYREPLPYIQKLDLAAAYGPFPCPKGLRCASCRDLSGWSSLSRTCPSRSMWIWNLPLRCFNVFHYDQYWGWALCAYGTECKGHHHGHDSKWIVGKDPEFTLYIEKEALKANDEFVSLDQAGLGPAQKIRLDHKDNMARYDQFINHGVVYRDTYDDWVMTGGLGGLIDSMLHGRVLANASTDTDTRDRRDRRIRPKLPVKWALGRRLRDQEDAYREIQNLHDWPGCCEWCHL